MKIDYCPYSREEHASMNGNPAYQEEFREELLNGEFVAMSPRPMFRSSTNR